MFNIENKSFNSSSDLLAYCFQFFDQKQLTSISLVCKRWSVAASQIFTQRIVEFSIKNKSFKLTLYLKEKAKYRKVSQPNVNEIEGIVKQGVNRFELYSKPTSLHEKTLTAFLENISQRKNLDYLVLEGDQLSQEQASLISEKILPKINYVYLTSLSSVLPIGSKVQLYSYPSSKVEASPKVDYSTERKTTINRVPLVYQADRLAQEGSMILD